MTIKETEKLQIIGSQEHKSKKKPTYYTSAFQSGLICCWSIWRYIIIRCTCNSYSIILKYNSTHRLALDEYEIFFVFQILIPSISLSLFVYFMFENAEWIHKNLHEEALPHPS